MSAADSLNQTQTNWGSPGYGPNPKENAQGMLFSNAHAVNKAAKAADRTGDEVGHKGYSKNRLDAARQLPVEVHYVTDPGAQAIKAQQGGELDTSALTPDQLEMGKRLTTNVVHDAVARSSMSPDDLELARAHGTHFRVSDLGTGGAGVFNSQSNRIGLHGEYIHDKPGSGASDIIMHEMGHAVDAGHRTSRSSGEQVPGKTTNTMPMSSPETAAIGEGFADSYALRHARGQGGGPVDRTGKVVPYESFNQMDWENYAGFAHDPDLSPQERGPSAYFESRAIHGEAKQLDLLGGQFQ